MNIFKTINELGKKAKDASIKIRVLQKEKNGSLSMLRKKY